MRILDFYHFPLFYYRTTVLAQSSFHTTWTSFFEMELEPNSWDWNGNELEHEQELEDMKRISACVAEKALLKMQ